MAKVSSNIDQRPMGKAHKKTRKPMSEATKRKISQKQKENWHLRRKTIAKSTGGDLSQLVDEKLVLTRQDINSKRDFLGLDPETVASAERSTRNGRFRDWADFCDSIYHGDSIVRGLVDANINDIAFKPIVVEPRKSQFKPLANFIQDRLDEIPLIQDAWKHLLFAVYNGVQFAEPIWTFDEVDQIWKIESIEPRHLRKFMLNEDLEWAFDDPYSPDTRIGELLYKDDTPPGAWIIFEPNEGSLYPQEAGLFRTAAMWSYLRRQGYTYWLAGLERTAFAGWAVFLPPNADDKEMNSAKAQMDNYDWTRSIVFKEGSTIQSLGANSSGGANDFYTIIQQLTKELMILFNGGSALTDAKSNTSTAVAEQQKARQQLLLSYATRLLHTLKLQLIKPLIDLNKAHIDSLLDEEARKELSTNVLSFPVDLRFKGLGDEVSQNKIPQSLIDVGGVSFNELRTDIGLPKWEDGDERVPSKFASAEVGLQETDTVTDQSDQTAGAVVSPEPSNEQTEEETDTEEQDVVSEEEQSEEVFKEAVGADFNGIQIEKMVELATQVAQGQLPRETAIALATISFPSRKREQFELFFETLSGFVPKPMPEQQSRTSRPRRKPKK